MSNPSSAVVLGASMAGLLAARVLADRFDRVTLVERDPLPAGAAGRKGVPQGAHAHGLLASGFAAIAEWFPGIVDELESHGAFRVDVANDFVWFLHGTCKLRQPSDLTGVAVSRPCLEAAVRRRVRALPNVTLLDGTEVVEPVFEPARGRVTGVRVRAGQGSEERLDAQLVVDATGRGSQTPRWLGAWGYPPPPVETVRVDVAYATRTFERRPGDFLSPGGAVVSDAPRSARIAAVLAAEGGRWIVTFAGAHGERAPADESAWRRFAAALPLPDVERLVASARPLSAIDGFRFPASQRRRYDRVASFPDGYVVVGDAVCSFNPIYGQGMSVAALEARALGECLRAGLPGLPRRFFRRIRGIVDVPWSIANGEDLRFPQVVGRRPPGFAASCRYLDRVHAAAAVDPRVAREFFGVLNLLAPPAALMAPRVLWRVLRHRARPAAAPRGDAGTVAIA